MFFFFFSVLDAAIYGRNKCDLSLTFNKWIFSGRRKVGFNFQAFPENDYYTRVEAKEEWAGRGDSYLAQKTTLI